MTNIQEEFEKFLKESENSLKYLILFGDNLKDVRVEKVRKLVIDNDKKVGQLYEYMVEFSRNDLRNHLSLVEYVDEMRGNGKNVEVLMANGDSFPIEANDTRYFLFDFAERLFLDIEFVENYLKVLLNDFDLYRRCLEI